MLDLTLPVIRRFQLLGLFLRRDDRHLIGLRCMRWADLRDGLMHVTTGFNQKDFILPWNPKLVCLSAAQFIAWLVAGFRPVELRLMCQGIKGKLTSQRANVGKCVCEIYEHSTLTAYCGQRGLILGHRVLWVCAYHDDFTGFNIFESGMRYLFGRPEAVVMLQLFS